MHCPHHILGSGPPRPASERTLYCDGSADAGFRDGVDVELSHWIPNRTPDPYRADTSTEIVLNHVAAHPERGWDLVVNNHVDVDGILSVFAGVEPELALAHRQTLVEAAEMGDFWGWGERPAQRLFQALALTIVEAGRRREGGDALYARGFEVARAVLGGCLAELPDLEPGIRGLAASVARIECGAIERRELGPRFAHYVVPAEMPGRDRACAVPGSNAPLDDHPLSPHARACFDADRVQLVSVAFEGGWRHDLHLPGYVWADTVTRWRPPGLTPGTDSNLHACDWPPLTTALAALGEAEARAGEWAAASRLTPFTSLDGRGFPIVASFLSGPGGAAATSGLAPEVVAEALCQAFDA